MVKTNSIRFFKINVMGEYQRITKEYIDFPKYCYFFIKEIQESIDEYNIKKVGDEIEITIETSANAKGINPAVAAAAIIEVIRIFDFFLPYLIISSFD